VLFRSRTAALRRLLAGVRPSDRDGRIVCDRDLECDCPTGDDDRHELRVRAEQSDGNAVRAGADLAPPGISVAEGGAISRPANRRQLRCGQYSFGDGLSREAPDLAGTARVRTRARLPGRPGVSGG